MTIDQYQDSLEAAFERELASCRDVIAIAREESDWSTWRLLSAHAEGIRGGLAIIRALYLEQMRQTA